jgi:CelD/BcsL family acetyltransferase involved in cellulose biosynthesis
MEIEVNVGPYDSLAETERLWTELEPRAAASFFLSWSWIGTWLETGGIAPKIVVARSGSRIVGLGLLGEARRRRFGLSWPSASLNEAGTPELDGIMIEDNGFLAESGSESEITAACLRHIVDREGEWRELRLRGVPQSVADAARALGLSAKIEAVLPCPFRDIDRDAGDTLSQLSATLRGQVQRSMRLYRERGTLALSPSADLADALDRFGEMETLHQRRWTGLGKPGAFAEPFFGQFHRALLTRGFPRGEADVLRVAAGTDAIGYLYSFFYRGEAYAYQSGFAYEASNQLKPGMVSHLLALDHCRERSIRRYRFLAGEGRYKRSLSTGAYPLTWLSLHRRHPAFWLEGVARGLRDRLLGGAVR